MTAIYIRGDEIYQYVDMPEVPRKGDILWLSSLTRGASDILEVLVSRVEWAKDQTTGTIVAWVYVRRRAATKKL